MDDSNEAGSSSKYEEVEGGDSNAGDADSNAEESGEGKHDGYRQRETLLKKV